MSSAARSCLGDGDADGAPDVEKVRRPAVGKLQCQWMVAGGGGALFPSLSSSTPVPKGMQTLLRTGAEGDADHGGAPA